LAPHQLNRVKELTSELELLLQPSSRLTKDQVENLTTHQAMMVRIHARRALLIQLLHQEFHMHELDDCGDYLFAATENWHRLFVGLWNNDFQNEVPFTKEFLQEDPQEWLGCDGEVRFAILEDPDDDAG
jgi:hypothetical protein